MSFKNTRLIDANTLEVAKFVVLQNDYAKGWNDAIDAIMENAPTKDAIPISFIEEQVELCNLIGFKRGEGCYMALIEDWRKEHAETD